MGTQGYSRNDGVVDRVVAALALPVPDLISGVRIAIIAIGTRHGRPIEHPETIGS